MTLRVVAVDADRSVLFVSLHAHGGRSAGGVLPHPFRIRNVIRRSYMGKSIPMTLLGGAHGGPCDGPRVTGADVRARASARWIRRLESAEQVETVAAR